MASPIFSNNLRKVITATLANAKICLDVYIQGGNAAAPIQVTQGANLAGENVDSTVSVAATFAPPANAVGFLLMNLDTSGASIRWAIGAAASASTGSQLQPGRDTGYIPCGAAISICAESGTQNVNVQWVLSS